MTLQEQFDVDIKNMEQNRIWNKYDWHSGVIYLENVKEKNNEKKRN